jgi:hypothetical protein
MVVCTFPSLLRFPHALSQAKSGSWLDFLHIERELRRWLNVERSDRAPVLQPHPQLFSLLNILLYCCFIYGDVRLERGKRSERFHDADSEP